MGMDDTAGTIVVGIDGSTSSQRALTWAVEQAVAEHRPLTLVTALSRMTPTLLDPTGGTPQEARELALRARCQKTLDTARALVAELAPDLTVLDAAVLEDPREALVALSRSASMIVLGSRGRGHMKSLLLGSTAVAVVRLARCPVVVHRPVDTTATPHGIAVGVDATEDSLPVLEFAYEQASLRKLPLTVVHSFWYFQEAPGEQDELLVEQRGAKAEQHRALEESVESLSTRYPAVTVHTETERGMPERRLLTLADEMNMLVVGAHHGRGAQQFMFGSVSVWLVEHATCPVAVVPLSMTGPT